MNGFNELAANLKIDVSKGVIFISNADISNLPEKITLPVVVTDMTDKTIAEKTIRVLQSRFGNDHEVIMVTSGGITDQAERDIICVLLPMAAGNTTSSVLPFDLTPLMDVMVTLRGDHGCPWDKAQTGKSLRRYFLEEVYELLDAIDEGDNEGIREELGDILYQISFHCQLAEEASVFAAQDVVDDIADKMKRRHPHVFQQKRVDKLGKSVVNWDKLKQKEKRQQHEYIVDGVVKGLPSLLQSYKLQEKAAKVGFEWNETEQFWQKVSEEWQEFREALTEHNPDHAEEEAGDVLFVLVNLFRRYNIEPECALHRANSKFRRRFSYVEDKVKLSRKSWQDFTLLELDSFWQEAKKLERKNNSSGSAKFR